MFSYKPFLFIGIVKDYYLAQAEVGGKCCIFWCSSSSWVFSQIPAAPSDPATIEKLKCINTLFTGEFDQVLFASSDKPKVID